MIGIIGDLHVGASYNLGKTDPKTQLNTRLLDFSETFNKIIDEFINRQVKLLILTGDIFETRHPTSAQLNTFGKCIRRALDSGIEILVNVGNHDQQRNISTTTVDVFGTLDLPSLKVFQDFSVFKYRNINIIFMPYRDKKMMGAETNSEAIKLIDEKLNELTKDLVGSKIVVGHFMLEKSPDESDPDSFSLNELILPLSMFQNYDLTVMGHIHKHEIISSKKPAIIYSGSMEKVSFGEKDHTKVSIILNPDNLENVEIIKTKTRNLYEINLDYSDLKNSLKNGINNKIIQDINIFDEKNRLTNSITKVIIKVKEEDLYFVDQAIIKSCVMKKGAMYCAGIYITSLNSRQLRNRSVTETLTGKAAFKLYIDSLTAETELSKKKLQKYAEEIIEEVEKK